MRRRRSKRRFLSHRAGGEKKLSYSKSPSTIQIHVKTIALLGTYVNTYVFKHTRRIYVGRTNVGGRCGFVVGYY